MNSLTWIQDQIPKVFSIAFLTLRETLRKRIVYFIFIISALFLFLNFTCQIQMGGKDQSENPDYQIYVVFLFFAFWNTVLALFLPVSLLGDELENKTYIPILSRPISSLTYIGGKSLGILTLIFTNGVFLIGTYLVKQRIGGEVFSWDLLKACFTMFFVFYFLILFGFVLVLGFGKNVAFFGGLALLVFSTFLDLFVYESVAANLIQTSDLKKQVLEVMYWILPQEGTVFFFSGSIFAKSLSQVHYYGEYSLIQIGVWIVLCFGLIKVILDRKEL
ncbi:ABC transporter permease [Leptospira santarosai]|uniref:ABC-2 family transporter protein n=3 Tax=Leptospira santarosai TaxID=28183 RepID=M6UNB9_9LEPT|nr:ABC transporter permease [Leptospira santarosai]EMO44306.1 ABC-2 family transporter protein [Leptospira santarosai str. ZUN179]EMO86332.1 ABC-2 family transporter protein [Leptospira santarosai str. AIM]EMP01404.1 ABC-2 family transporter protein [Leptospira santarosai str. HAI1380]EMP82563.1 ABC-2 family transporter protein [Leptospira santarosai str. CBC1531]EPG81066.1 ABC-2 family transporter protein [Leptospira santarosai serovar Shermani str. 1342KT]